MNDFDQKAFVIAATYESFIMLDARAFALKDRIAHAFYKRWPSTTSMDTEAHYKKHRWLESYLSRLMEQKQITEYELEDEGPLSSFSVYAGIDYRRYHFFVYKDGTIDCMAVAL